MEKIIKVWNIDKLCMFSNYKCVLDAKQIVALYHMLHQLATSNLKHLAKTRVVEADYSVMRLIIDLGIQYLNKAKGSVAGWCEVV